jgi:hypothetical protein
MHDGTSAIVCLNARADEVCQFLTRRLGILSFGFDG